MSQIKGKDTKPEIIVRKYLFSKGFRYKIHDKSLPGKPDIVLPKYKTVIFINGCFWHGHEDCSCFVIPKTRTEWWMNKILKNKENDKKNITLLRKFGWHVFTIFECELKAAGIDKTLESLIKSIKKTVIKDN
jgi:DNA mismatch endonuclease (patch repair protein)